MLDYFALIDLANVAVTFALLGLIWTIQIVHYPSFHFIEENNFSAFEKFHTRNISFVVVPLMLVELLLAIILLLMTNFTGQYILSFILLMLIWLSTFFFSVPCHKKLIDGKDEKVIAKLIQTNWIRTVLWSLKAVLVSL